MDGWTHGVSGSVIHADRVVHVEHVWNTAISFAITGTVGREDDALAAIAWCSRFFADVDATFYSDSMNDLPLLEKVQHPVATNPDPRLRQLAIQRGWRILDLFQE